MEKRRVQIVEIPALQGEGGRRFVLSAIVCCGLPGASRDNSLGRGQRTRNRNRNRKKT